MLSLKGGGEEGGARHRSAKAVAKTEPTLCVIKGSEDAMKTQQLTMFEGKVGMFEGKLRRVVEEIRIDATERAEDAEICSSDDQSKGC